ncbi:MAG: hypothetical protein AAF809_00400 [Bacteroidota bacterium]
MAHWIAELMERAESAETPEARERAQEACARAIQTLWAQRQHWPYGAPLQRVAESLSALAEAPERFEQDRPTPEAGWGGAVDLIDRLGHQEWEIVRQAAIAEIDLSEERKTLETAPESLDEKEREIIETLSQLQDRQNETYFMLGPLRADGFGDLNAEEKTERVRQALSDVAEQREQAFTQAAATSPLARSE